LTRFGSLPYTEKKNNKAAGEARAANRVRMLRKLFNSLSGHGGIPARNKVVRGMGDNALLDLVQRQTLRYFWDFGHPVSGMARERTSGTYNYDCADTVTTGGTGFGIMAMIAGTERGWLSRRQFARRMDRIVGFLEKADKYHGVFPHFMNGETGKTIPFGPKDDGGDLVETSFLMMGLLSARQYLMQSGGCQAKEIGARIDKLWRDVEWDWHMPEGPSKLYWHWSPNNGWAMNHGIRGWNECLITYVLATASPTHPIPKEAYEQCWAAGDEFRNGKSYDGRVLPLGPEKGGPLFLSHYSFMGLDPRGLKDRHADYWEQNFMHTLINRQHCIDNPGGFKGYGEKCWGLTACDGNEGYSAHSPTNDKGVIAPTAALSAMPYAPHYAMQALRHFYEDKGGTLWNQYGFADAFNETAGWTADSQLAIDQGPIVVMIENARTGLLWQTFMGCPEVKRSLKALGFASHHIEQPQRKASLG
jgi:hypothetical protein